jgi:hypothetical protein
MIPIFKYGNSIKTSCTLKSLFKDLKTIILKHKPLSLRFDEFLKIHIIHTFETNNILADKPKIQYEKSLSNEEINNRYQNINIYN